MYNISVDDTIARADRPDRAGLKTLVTYLEPEIARRIKVIAAETDMKVQEIGKEAVLQWLERYDAKRRKKIG